jgi:ubiquitin-conjugating enzyme E2 A
MAIPLRTEYHFIDMTTARRRLMMDLKNLEKDEHPDFDAKPNPGSCFEWTGEIHGPLETDWEGGVFKIALTVPEEYPMEPPTARFLTPIFHPNVYTDGRVCVNVLQDKWEPTNDVRSILISL